MSSINRQSIYHSLLLSGGMFLVGVALFLNPIYLSKSAKKYRQLLSGASILFFLPSTALARWVKKQVPYLEIEEESEQEAFCRELATKRLKAEAYADWEVQSAIASLGMQYNSSPMKEINPQISREIAETEPHKILESAPQTRRSDSTNIHPLESSDISPIAGAGLVTLIGTQGSGKSTLASTLIRYRIRQGHTVAVFDHHYAYGAYAPLKVYGKGKTHHQQFSDIEEGLIWFIGEKEKRYQIRQDFPQSEWDFEKHPITIVVDELGEYNGNVDKELMQKFLQTICTGIRKANLYFVGISQHDTSAMFGGTKGLSKLLKDGVVNLHLESEPDQSKVGGYKPTGRGELKVNGKNLGVVCIPDLRHLFPGDENDFSDLFANIEEEKLTDISRVAKKPESSAVRAISSLQDIYLLPKVDLSDRSKLPQKSGVYFVLANGNLQYIGSTQGFRERWGNNAGYGPHHRLEYFLATQGKGAKVEICYFPCSDWEALEYKLIAKFKPPINNQPLDIPLPKELPHPIYDVEAALEKAFAASPDFSEDEILFMAEEGLGVDEILIKLKGANISERDRVRYRVKIEEIFEREFL